MLSTDLCSSTPPLVPGPLLILRFCIATVSLASLDSPRCSFCPFLNRWICPVPLEVCPTRNLKLHFQFKSPSFKTGTFSLTVLSFGGFGILLFHLLFSSLCFKMSSSVLKCTFSYVSTNKIELLLKKYFTHNWNENFIHLHPVSFIHMKLPKHQFHEDGIPHPEKNVHFPKLTHVLLFIALLLLN